MSDKMNWVEYLTAEGFFDSPKIANAYAELQKAQKMMIQSLANLRNSGVEEKTPMTYEMFLGISAPHEAIAAAERHLDLMILFEKLDRIQKTISKC
jgi:hypothetical protein